jgi:hypothetical protein
MKELVQKGQEKISKSSRITTGVGDVVDFILSAKAMINRRLQTAAMPCSSAGAVP